MVACWDLGFEFVVSFRVSPVKVKHELIGIFLEKTVCSVLRAAGGGGKEVPQLRDEGLSGRPTVLDFGISLYIEGIE